MVQPTSFFRFFRPSLALWLLFSAKSALALSYQMADLEVLAKEKNTREYFAHALDIRPSERQLKWRELTSQMGMLLLQEAAKEKPPRLATYDLIEKIARWPALASDEFFGQKRAEYVTGFFKNCFGQFEARACLTRFETYLGDTKDNPNFTLEMMALLKQKLPEYDRENLLLRLTKGEFAREFCRRDQIQQDLERLLLAKTLAHFKDRARTPMPQVKDYLSKDCAEVMATRLRQFLLAPEIERSRASFLLLSQLKKLETGDLDQFYTYYLLSGPEVGELFNLAWNNLKLIGSDYERRRQLLRGLAGLDPLPGKAFGDKDVRRRRTLAEAFFTHFPEYTTLYLKTCLLYLEGKGEYPRGNPTPYCDDLMMVGRMNNSVSDEISRKHSALRHFKLPH